MHTQHDIFSHRFIFSFHFHSNYWFSFYSNIFYLIFKPKKTTTESYFDCLSFSNLQQKKSYSVNLTDKSCHVSRRLWIEIWFSDYCCLCQSVRFIYKIFIICRCRSCRFWRDCHYSRCWTMRWSCCRTLVHDCVVVIYWVFITAICYTWGTRKIHDK